MKSTGSCPSNKGAWFGAIFGLNGWLIGLVAMCLAGGHMELLGEALLLGLPLGAAMSALAIFVIELVLKTHGRGRVFLFSLWGVILFCLGVMLLLFNFWLAPLVDARPELVQTLSGLGAIYRVGNWVPALCLVGSAVTLILAIRSTGHSCQARSSGAAEGGEIPRR